MIRKLSDRDHIRQRPAMYVGAMAPTKSMEYILEDGKIVHKEVEYSPALVKIINEIIDNCVDVAIKSNFETANLIQVNINSKNVSIEDNGTGIPVVKNDGHYLPELCWNHARAGSNFDDDENRTQIGMNGVGSYATACFSKQFVGTTDDGKNRYTIKISNGAESFTESIKPSKGKTGTLVTFYPDLEMFNVKEIDEVTQLIIKQRLINLSMSFPKITFKFNKRVIRTGTFKNYLKMFSETFELFESDKYKFAILPNETDDFKQFSYVNGLRIPDGGTHIDIITTNVVHGIRQKLIKKYKSIKPGDIRNKIMVVAFLKDLPNPKFSSQSKEKITNSVAEMNEYFGEIPFDKIVAKILRMPEIIDHITELYRAKEEIARRRELKNADKKSTKKPKSEKFMPPIGEWKDLFICEGDSAANSISKLIGRQGRGFYAMFGVPPNAYSAQMKDILKSSKMTDLKNIIGLKYSETTQNDLNFENIIITTDFDLPGHFIAGQIIGMLFRFGRNLFEEGRVKRLVTPLIVATNNKEEIQEWFYDFDSYKEFEKKNKSKKYNYDYKKGLGSWDQEELDVVIKKDGLDKMTEVFELDENAEKMIETWLGNNSQLRKDELKDVPFDMMNV